MIPQCKLREGQLVVFSPSHKDLQNFPFVTCSYEGGGKFTLYEEIDLQTFPSWDDFRGYKVVVPEGESGILLCKLGVPTNLALFQLERNDLDMSVYAVLMRGQRVHVFGTDLVTKS